MLDLVRRLLRDPIDPAPMDDADAFERRLARAAAGARSTVASAALGGLASDRLGWAFAGGYRAALRALSPAIGDDVAALCATEEGGGHPRAIRATLAPVDGGFELSGHKRWSTLATRAQVLLVVARLGDGGDRPKLRVAKVPVASPGLTLTPMPPPPFCPEIGHAEVRLDRVRVAPDQLLEGDGYDAVLKPFRTIEDVHVFAAALGHLIGFARRNALPLPLVERALAAVVALEGIAAAPPLDPATHLALAGLLAIAAPLFDELATLLGAVDAPAAARLRRDLPLLLVASGVRQKRTERAWETPA